MTDYISARKAIVEAIGKVDLPDPLSLYSILYEITNMTAWILEGYHGVHERDLKQMEDLAIRNIISNDFIKPILKV